jgi:hypothetical protein
VGPGEAKSVDCAWCVEGNSIEALRVMTIVEAFAPWAEYNRRACAHGETFGLPGLTPWYDQVLDDPRLQTARLADFLECRSDDLAAKGRLRTCGAEPPSPWVRPGGLVTVR